jgi:uncharacterized protein
VVPIIRQVSICFASVLLCACSNLSAGNLFSHYSAQTEPLHQALAVGDYPAAQELLPESLAGDILDNMEKGRVYWLNQQYDLSRSSFNQSDAAIALQQQRALISVTDQAASVGALTTNDNLLEYVPGDYELGFLHLYLALSYLQSNDLDGALVEIRRANQVQESAKKTRESELEEAQAKVNGNGVSTDISTVMARYADIGHQLQAIQNGYLFYLSALLYETSNNFNDAYIDYQRALALYPDNRAIIEGAMRTAEKLSMVDDLSQMNKRYGPLSKLTMGQGRVIVIQEQGVVDAMKEWKVALPVFGGGGQGAIYSLALPYYPSLSNEQYDVARLNQTVINADLLADVNLMAEKGLTEKLPVVITRQILRLVVKNQLRLEASKSDDAGIANLMINVWNTLTEQPDTRSWTSLPARAFSASTVVTAGPQVLQIADKQYQFDVPNLGTTLVWVSRQGDQTTLWHKQLGRL